MPRSMSRVRISSPAPFFFKGLREIANPLIPPKIRSRSSQGATVTLRFSSTTQLGFDPSQSLRASAQAYRKLPPQNPPSFTREFNQAPSARLLFNHVDILSSIQITQEQFYDFSSGPLNLNLDGLRLRRTDREIQTGR